MFQTTTLEGDYHKTEILEGMGRNKDQWRDETDQIDGSSEPSILMTENNNIEEFVDVKMHTNWTGA